MYNRIIAGIRSTRSKKEKSHWLGVGREDIILKEILQYAYNPFKHYYISRIPKTWVGKGGLTLGSYLVEWTSSLERLASRDISGQMAKNLVKEIITDLTPEDAELFKCILKKDLRAGISTTTINGAIPGLVPHFGVNLAKKYEGWTGPKWTSLKIDGLRGRFEKGEFFTRNGHKIYGLEHLISQIPTSIRSLDGELDLPGIDFDAASGKIRSHSSTDEVVYNVFGYPDGTMSFTDRYDTLKEIIPQCGSSIKLVKHVLVHSQERVEHLFEQALAAGYEGLVLNEPDDVYVEKRHSNMQKLKDSDTIDIKVIGLEAGAEGKQYENCLGAFVCELPNGRQVRVGQGHKGSLSDAKRKAVWNNQDKWLGRTIEVLFHQSTAKGSLRHPRFVRPRDDKS